MGTHTVYPFAKCEILLTLTVYETKVYFRKSYPSPELLSTGATEFDPGPENLICE